MKKSLCIIVPVYNVENYLSRCVDSLLNQTVSDFEIVLVDDGSTDQSGALAEEYATRFPERVRCLHKENGGLSDARNYGLEHSTSDIVAFVDSDDWTEPDMVEEVMKKLEETNADIAVFDLEYVFDKEAPRYSEGGCFDRVIVEDHPEILSINPSACNKFFNRALFDQIRFPYRRLYEDLGTIPKLIYNAELLVKINRPFYKYYQRTSSIVHTQSPRIFEIYDSMDDVRTYIQSKVPQNSAFLKEVQRMYIVHGADLTTVRVNTFENEKKEYTRMNAERLAQSYPHWYHNPAVREFGFKKWVLFTLLRFRMYSLLVSLFK